MGETLTILFLAAEAEPFYKVGGLADVAGSLPVALRGLSPKMTGGMQLDIRLVLPLHCTAQSEPQSLLRTNEFPVYRRGGSIRAQVFERDLNGVPAYFITGQPILNATSIYSADPAADREKYIFFSLAALELSRRMGWRPDIVHANDWHTALALYTLRARRGEAFFSRTAGLLTVHNLPYMGGDASDVLAAYGLAPLFEENLPSWARSQPLPMGLWAADAIVPVSETYAREILTPDFGCDLQDFLKQRANSITGIVNGVDVNAWNPLTDRRLAATFDADSLGGRLENKTALQKKMGFPIEARVPLLAMVTRVDQQKGLDLVFEALPKLAEKPWQFLLLGSGAPQLEAAARSLQAKYPERVQAVLRYDANLSRLIYGGADMFLMPSRYEPCGLGQMLAMRYGCVPVVRATGGLKDTVEEGKTGFLFARADVDEFVEALQRALGVYASQEKWRRFQRNGMKQDFSWTRSARQYATLYRCLVPEAVPDPE
ncbi:MAG: glycogen synthase [Anaerolineales bacterium]|nr:glycogen synthase [Anaerolineales bacterium]